MDEIRSLLAAGDSFAAIEHIQSAGTPAEIAASYRSLLSNLYWKAHDLPAVVIIGRAGILYCLGQSLMKDASPESIDQFRSLAKSLAYDVGSFTWPGWEEPGITPTAADLAFGMDCAKLNLRLAIEMKKPADRLSMAHWLVGAQGLSAGDFRMAEQQFQLALDVQPANDACRSMETLNGGFLAIAKLGMNSRNAAASDTLHGILNRLETDPHEDAKYYVAQLAAARRLFLPRMIPGAGL